MQLEEHMRAEAHAEVRDAVLRHGNWLGARVTDELDTVRLEAANAVEQHAAQQSELAVASRAVAAHGEAQFVAEARAEMTQYEAFLVHQSASDRHDIMRSSAAQLNGYYENLYGVRMRSLEEHYDQRFSVAAEEMMSEYRAGLVRTEARAATEHRNLHARLAVSEEEAQSLRQRADAQEASLQHALRLAVSKERTVTAQREAAASQREAVLRRELEDETQRATAIATEMEARAAAARDATQREVNQWAAELVATSDERLVQAEALLQQ